MKRVAPHRARTADATLEQAWAQMRQGRAEQAESLFRAAAAADPRRTEALQMAGVLAGQRGEADEAIELLRRALAQRAGDPKILNNLGNAYAAVERYAEALDCFDRSLAQRAGHPGALANRGRALMKLGRLDEALAAAGEALAAQPEAAALHVLRGQILTRMHFAAPTPRTRDAAVAALHEALQHGGEADDLNFVLASLGAAPAPDKAPSKGLAEIFDKYAGRFDARLVDQLQYRGPQLIAQVLQPLAPAMRCDIVDLGCGTGLCGPLLKPLARRLVGVDLSAGMLARAGERALYDEFVQSDLVDFLQSHPEAFDLAVAADVLIYFGDLDPVFGAVARSLRPGGLFAFTVEAHDGDGAVLQPTRRYAHGRGLLQALAAAHGLRVEALEAGTLRTERDQPVAGWIGALRRTPAPPPNPTEPAT